MQTQKVQVIFQSKIANQYCLGMAKLMKGDQVELRQVQNRCQTDTVWKFKAIKAVTEKPIFIHTTLRIVTDLRASQAQALLQSVSFPVAPVPRLNSS